MKVFYTPNGQKMKCFGVVVPSENSFKAVILIKWGLQQGESPRRPIVGVYLSFQFNLSVTRYKWWFIKRMIILISLFLSQ